MTSNYGKLKYALSFLLKPVCHVFKFVIVIRNDEVVIQYI